MINLIRADLFKLRHTLTLKILLGIGAASALAMTMIAYLIPQGKLDESMTGIGFMFSDINVISILGAVLASVLICGDLEHKTIHDAVASGRNRGGIIIGKAIVMSGVLALILLPYAILTTIALVTGFEFSMGSVVLGYLHVLTTEAAAGFTAAETGRLLAVMLTLVMVYIAQLSITIPLAFVLKKPVLVIAIYYGFSILSGQLSGMGDSSQLMYRIYTCTPFAASYTLVNLDTAPGYLFQAILVSLGFMILMIAAAYGAFRRSELK